jgi:D-alanyl-D-alanine dipeptidase
MLDFTAVTRKPDGLVFRDDLPAARPLPRFVEPGRLPTAPHAHSGEGLVELNHPKIIAVNVYRAVGVEGAAPTVWVRETVAEKLQRAAEALPDMFGFAVFDGWRSLTLQRGLYEAARQADPDNMWFEEPSPDPECAPAHLTGGAVDVTLTYDKELLSLGTAYGELTERTATRAFEDTPGLTRDLRRLLYWSLAKERFIVTEGKWWHFEYGTRRWAVLSNLPPIYGATS